MVLVLFLFIQLEVTIVDKQNEYSLRFLETNFSINRKSFHKTTFCKQVHCVP